MVSEGIIIILLPCVIVFIITSFSDQLPTPPINSDILLLSSSNGSFLLDVRNTQPNITNISSSLVHSFVVRVDGDNVTTYWWMVSICSDSLVKILYVKNWLLCTIIKLLIY